MNFEERKWARYYRRIDREANLEVWNGDEDVLNLCTLFGEEGFEQEDWNYNDIIDISILFREENCN